MVTSQDTLQGFDFLYMHSSKGSEGFFSPSVIFIVASILYQELGSNCTCMFIYEKFVYFQLLYQTGRKKGEKEKGKKKEGKGKKEGMEGRGRKGRKEERVSKGRKKN